MCVNAILFVVGTVVHSDERILVRESLSTKNVGAYVRLVLSPPRRSPTATAVPPQEFRNVVANGSSVVPELLDLLEDSTGQVRSAAWLALKEITHRDYGEVRDFATNDPTSRQKSEDARARWWRWWDENRSRSRVDWFISDLDDHDPAKKQWAIYELGALGDPAAIGPLRMLVKHPDLGHYAVRALAFLGDGYAIPYLIEDYLVDDTAGIRREGIELLEKLTGSTLGYDPKDSDAHRAASVRRWREWWELNKGDFTH